MIRFSDVEFGYKKKRTLYQNLKMEVKAGHIYGLLGKNGAGKSTLLKLIAGLVFPVSGHIEVMGYRPGKRLPSFLEKIFLIPEEVETPDIDVVAFADSYAPFYPNFDKNQFLELLREFEVPFRNLKQMSYGQKKKTWIALGIAANTRLLILDEPTNGLDIPSKRQFRKLLAASLNEERCVIISTHQIRDLDNLIDNIIIVDEGEMILNAPVWDITAKLSFRQIHNGVEPANCLYAEDHLLGLSAVLLNESGTGEDSRMDTELFFNASIAHKITMKKLFA